jgi:hypothetical protein
MKTREDLQSEFEKVTAQMGASSMKPTDILAAVQTATLIEIACQLADLNKALRESEPWWNKVIHDPDKRADI